MLTYALIFFVILALMLWLGLGKKGEDAPVPGPVSGPGTVVRLPGFKPIPRQPPIVPEPNPVPVGIGVIRDADGIPVDLTIPEVTLGENDQAAWSAGATREVSAGKLEIRFSPNVTPFGATAFTVARGGVVKSGAPVPGRPTSPRLGYTVLLTTADGFLLRKAGTLTIRRSGAQSLPDAPMQRPLQEPAGEAPRIGTVIQLPKFTPIARRPGNGMAPPAREVRIAVARDAQGIPVAVLVNPTDLTLNPDEQIAWSSGPRIENDGGKIEIRFAPNASPFGGDRFTTARGGMVFSGRPADRGTTRKYIVLLTTADGTLLSADASVTIGR